MGEHGDEWEFQRIGTESEKSSVEKELHELRERLAKVEEWKQRKQEIEAELNKVWVDGGDELAPPPYFDESQVEVNSTSDGEVSPTTRS
jgi:ATP-binding cassette subfamily D (ALD) long-chain fatty acid import protein